MAPYKFTPEDRERSAAARKKKAKRLRELRAQAEELAEYEELADPKLMRGVLAKSALKGGDEITRVRAAQAYMRETRSDGEEDEIEPLFVADAPPAVLEELDAQLALPLPDGAQNQPSERTGD